MTFWIGFGIYLALGLLSLTILEIATKRISRRIWGSSLETQKRMALTGQYYGVKSSMALTIGAILLFWVVVIIGALTSRRRNNGDTGQGTNNKD
jgi:uncharacterized membrane protein